MEDYNQRVIDWQGRVRQEKTELDDKIIKLNDFVEHNAFFNGLDRELQSLLVGQLATMMHYSMILGLRIARF